MDGSKLLENSKLALVSCSDELRGRVSSNSPNSESCTSTPPSQIREQMSGPEIF